MGRASLDQGSPSPTFPSPPSNFYPEQSFAGTSPYLEYHIAARIETAARGPAPQLAQCLERVTLDLRVVRSSLRLGVEMT